MRCAHEALKAKSALYKHRNLPHLMQTILHPKFHISQEASEASMTRTTLKLN